MRHQLCERYKFTGFRCDSLQLNSNSSIITMSFLQKLNNVAKIKEGKSLAALEVDKKYKIMSIRKTVTKFGERLVLELEDCCVFLGARFNTLSEEDIGSIQLKAQTGKLYLISHGKCGSAVDIQFVEEE